MATKNAMANAMTRSFENSRAALLELNKIEDVLLTACAALGALDQTETAPIHSTLMARAADPLFRVIQAIEKAAATSALEAT
jgi:hypothetical protein